MTATTKWEGHAMTKRKFKKLVEKYGDHHQIINETSDGNINVRRGYRQAYLAPKAILCGEVGSSSIRTFEATKDGLFKCLRWLKEQPIYEGL